MPDLPGGRPGTAPSVILLYHHIAPPEDLPRDPERLRSEGWAFVHSPAEFQRQLEFLRRRGYQFVSLGELLGQIEDQGQEHPQSVVVTFDDGWIDNWVHGVPVLEKLGIPATFFVTTGHLRSGLPDSKRLSGAQLRSLADRGFTIGSHTRNHADLARVPVEVAREELQGSRLDLERVLGRPADFLAYPGGSFNARVVDLARQTGYRAACSVLGPDRNTSDSRYWLFRDVLSPGLNTLGDRYRLSPLTRRMFSFRVRDKLRKRLAGVGPGPDEAP